MVVSIDECVATVGIPVAARAMPKIIGAILPELHMAFRQSLLTLAISRHGGVWDRNGYCAMAWNSLWLTIFCLAKLCQKKKLMSFSFLPSEWLYNYSLLRAPLVAARYGLNLLGTISGETDLVEHVMTL